MFCLATFWKAKTIDLQKQKGNYEDIRKMPQNKLSDGEVINSLS